MKSECSSRNTAVWIFLSSFVFVFLLLQNLPFTFGDDLNVIHVARNASWGQLLKEFANPFTAAWYVHGLACQLSTRIFQTALFRFFYDLGGYSVNLYWSYKAVGFALCCSFTYLFVRLGGGNRWAGICGAVFFALCAPVFMTTSWIADTEVAAQGLLAVAFYFFLGFFRTGDSGKNKTARLAVFFLSAWCAMKLKETARTIPIICGAFLVYYFFYLRRYRKTAVEWSLLILTAVLLFSIIPWIHSPEVHVDSESRGALKQIRFSGLVLLGLRLLDYFILPLVYGAVSGIALLFSRKNPGFSQKSDGENGVFFPFLILWLAFSSSGFMFNFKVQDNWRYLVTPLLPATILVFACIGILLNRFYAFIHFRPIQKIWQVLLLIASLFQCFLFGSGRTGLAFKLDEFLYVRNFYGGTDIAIHKLVSRVYALDFKTENPGWAELHSFYHDQKARFGETQRKEWDANETLTSDKLQAALDKWGSAYVFSFDASLEDKYAWLKNIYQDTTDNQSIYARMLKKVKKKAVRRFYLYKFVPEKVNTGRP